jgi:hypothetical protein
VTLPDIINGTFEASGGFFILQSVLKLYRDKIVRGVHWLPIVFFSTWGYWNLYYYPHLSQWVSFWGSLGITAVNTVWASQILYYIYLEKQRDRCNNLPSH